MGNLDDLLNLLGCQLAASLHRKLGRTVLAGESQSKYLDAVVDYRLVLERLFQQAAASLQHYLCGTIC